MKQDNVVKFLENYHNEGMLKDLPQYVKTKNIEFKKTNVTKAIKYYHWFIIEMFFSMQGGTHEVLNHVKGITSEYFEMIPNPETGEFEESKKKKTALFVEIKLNWQGEELIELYPIFDSSNSKVITLPDSQDLNNSYKRGLVRGIARISGIGGDRFGDYDDQFGGADETLNVKDKEDDELPNENAKIKDTHVEEKVTTPKTTKKGKKEEPKPEVKQEVKQEVVEEPDASDVEEEDSDDYIKNFLAGDEIPPKETQKTPKEEKPLDKKIDKIVETQTKLSVEKDTYGEDTEEYAELLLYIKREQKKKGLATEVKAFIASKGKELFSELNYKELLELKTKLSL